MSQKEYAEYSLVWISTKPKNSIPLEYRKAIIYKISCKGCPQSYVGQSGRSLSQRMKEHKRAVSQGDCNASALAEHSLTSGQEIDWEDTSILGYSDYFLSLSIYNNRRIQ